MMSGRICTSQRFARMTVAIAAQPEASKQGEECPRVDEEWTIRLRQLPKRTERLS